VALHLSDGTGRWRSLTTKTSNDPYPRGAAATLRREAGVEGSWRCALYEICAHGGRVAGAGVHPRGHRHTDSV